MADKDFPVIDFGLLKGCAGIKDILSRSRFHAYIISGEEGSGRHAVAELLAAAFLCENKEKVPCGICPSCKKRITGNHGDLIRIDGTVKTDEMRSWLELLPFAPGEGVCRVFIFDNADRLNPTVQNVLLKTLEEPPAGNVFIFIARSPESLLQTVRSRCVSLRTDNENSNETDNKERENCRKFIDAVYKNDIKAQLEAAAYTENAAKDDKRNKYKNFLLISSVILGEDIKAAAAENDYKKLEKAAHVKEITDGVIRESLDVNVNISLRLSYIITKINSDR